MDCMAQCFLRCGLNGVTPYGGYGAGKLRTKTTIIDTRPGTRLHRKTHRKTRWENGKIVRKPWENGGLPSGKLTHSYGKSPCWIGKRTVNLAIFNSKLLVITRLGKCKLKLPNWIQIYPDWWFHPPLIYMSSSIGMIIPNKWKNKTHGPVNTNQYIYIVSIY